MWSAKPQSSLNIYPVWQGFRLLLLDSPEAVECMHAFYSLRTIQKQQTNENPAILVEFMHAFYRLRTIQKQQTKTLPYR